MDEDTTPTVEETPVIETPVEIEAGQTPEEATIDPIEGAQIHNK